MLRGLILDLDGTVYCGEAEVPGAAAFVARCRERGLRCLFVTNRANRSPAAVSRHLRALGIRCAPEDVFTSAQATALQLRGRSVYMIGEAGLRAALRAEGVALTDDRPDVVVASFDRGFSYAKLRTAATLILRGARFVATNADRGLPTEDGMIPGSGAVVAALAAATGRTPVIVGKPQPLIMKLALRRLGLKPAEVLNVGDNVETDVPAGVRAGIPTALLLTGVTTARAARRAPVRPNWVVRNYAELGRLVDRLAAAPSAPRHSRG
jgi:4-nitrophenyl phosphatase